MVFPHISDDLIAGIIGHLSDDIGSLKKCSTVAPSFTIPCQKSIFAIVTFTSASCQDRFRRLAALLNKNPSIALYIRELCIIDRGKGKGLDSGWMPVEQTLPPVLSMLTALRSLSLTFRHVAYVEWSRFTEPFRSSLLALFKSPSLSALKLANVCMCHFPFFVLGTLHQLKRLSILSCQHSVHGIIRDSALPRLPPLGDVRQLESLEIGGLASSRILEVLVGPSSQLDLSSLREISIHEGFSMHLKTLRLLSTVIWKASTSITSLMWSYPQLDTRMLCLGLYNGGARLTVYIFSHDYQRNLFNTDRHGTRPKSPLSSALRTA